MYILGIWDGHDSGAALLDGDRIIYAANEERFTKRKLEVKFPYNSINAALKYEGIKPSDVEIVAFPTTELTKTISRIFPMQKEKYYQFRRRKMLKPRFEHLMHYTKYAMTSIGVLPLCDALSKYAIRKELSNMGFSNFHLYSVDHHTAHASSAAFTSGYKKSMVVTIDGVGDGNSGSVSTFKRGELKREFPIAARDSLGIFYEQVTNILGMRELEDEGKIMAMADFSYPFGFEKNKLKDFFSVDGTKIAAKYGPISQYDMLERIAWSTPKEQFAYMAQQVLEVTLQKFFNNIYSEYGIRDFSLAGGIMSNVKANMKIREIDGIEKVFIFPHMGDGGIALGAAMHANYMLNDIIHYDFNAYLGENYSNEEIRNALRKEKGLKFEDEGRSVEGHAAELVSKNNYVFWFQGRMEYGPRALGNRSIVAKAGSDDVKERLNLHVKQREWFQPFAPSMLEEEANVLLEDVGEFNKFMTMAYRVRKEKADVMKSVVHVDMTARPQMVGDENPRYRNMLSGVKKRTGYGVVLNTSFNIHGLPIVMTPQDAITTMKSTNTRYMFLGDFFVEKKV